MWIFLFYPKVTQKINFTREKKNTQIRLFNVQPRTEDNLWSYSTLSVTILSQVSGGGGVVKRTTHASVVTGTHGNTPLVPLLSRHRRSLCTTLLLHILRLYGKTPKWRCIVVPTKEYRKYVLVFLYIEIVGSKGWLLLAKDKRPTQEL